MVLSRPDNAHVLLRQYADGGSCFEDLVLNTLQWMQVDSPRPPHLVSPFPCAGAQLPLTLDLTLTLNLTLVLALTLTLNLT